MDVTVAILNDLDQDFVLGSATLADPEPDEVVVRIAGVGLCHTDLAVQHGHLPFLLPGVVGHEGSGTVLAIGDNVTKVGVGDHVAMTFNSCGTCVPCTKGKPSYCDEFMSRNFGGARADGTSPLSNGDQALGSYFFGQSSFGTHAIARDRNVVKIDDRLDISLAGPLGCGIQTGAGAVMRSMKCEQGSSLLITGGGSVGLAAVLGAVVQGVETIIVAEPVAARRELALGLGATHVLDPTVGPLSKQVREILPPGIDYALDTTAIGPVLTEAIASLARPGTLGLVGVPANPEATLPLGLIEMQGSGLRVMGIVEGDSDPDTFLPELVSLHLAGRFPFDRLIQTMPLSQINTAVTAQSRGEVVKVVLLPE